VQFPAAFPTAESTSPAKIPLNWHFLVHLPRDWCNNAGPWIALSKKLEIANFLGDFGHVD
jgi:hypothetical protein